MTIRNDWDESVTVDDFTVYGVERVTRPDSGMSRAITMQSGCVTADVGETLSSAVTGWRGVSGADSN